MYLSEAGNINLTFNQNVEEIIKSQVENQDFEFNNIKSNQNITEEDWVKNIFNF